MHLDMQFTRYRADNSAIGRFRSLWIVTRQEGRWAVAARSSFADQYNQSPVATCRSLWGEGGDPAAIASPAAP